MLRFFFFIIGLTFISPVFSQVAFYHYGIEKGLPEARIISISQDSTGFIWLAGENSLYRFDGNQFYEYKNATIRSSSVPFIRINTLFTDSRGKLWIGSNNGLSYYNPNTNGFIKLGEEFGLQRILDIFEDKNGLLWLASEFGLARFDSDTEKTDWFTAPNSSKNAVYKNLPSNYIAQITGQPDGKIWLSTYSEGLWLFDPETEKIEDFSQIEKTDFSKFFISEIHYNSGTLYLGTQADGFFWLEPQKRTVKNEKINQLANAIQHFRQLNDSIFWLATNNGLFKYNILTGGFNRYTNVPNNPLSLYRTVVNYVYLDNNYNLWLSLGIRGINYGLTQVPFSHFEVGEKGAYQLTHKEVTSILFDLNENMWLGYEAGLIEKHTNDPLLKKQYGIKTNNSVGQIGSVMAIYEDSKNRIWAGGWQTGLIVLVPGGNTFEPAKIKPYSAFNLVATADVRGLTEDKKGNIWIGFHGIGIGKYNPESQTMKLFRHNGENQFSGLSNDFVYNLCFDRHNSLWIASAHGITMLDPETEHFTTFFHDPNNPKTLNSNTVFVVYCDNAGSIWAGTDKGLNAYSPALKNFIPVFTDKDFSGLIISSIQSVKPGEIWVSTTSGIFRINYTWNADQTGMKTETSYFNHSDGLLSSNYLTRSSATNGDGTIFFGGNEGIDLFNPEEVSKYNIQKAKALITELKVDSKPLFPNQITGKDGKMKLVLNHNHRLLYIRFTALEFSNTGIKNFRYKLDGIHDDWVYLQNEQIASFTHLPPGNYTFMVETKQKDHEWTGDNTTIEIVVKKPFWLTIPFFIFMVLILAGIIYFTERVRSKALLLRQKELEKIIQERTLELTQKNLELEKSNHTKNKFFSIISHDLRSPFSGLLGILELLNKPGDVPAEMHHNLLKSAYKAASNTFNLLENLLTWASSQMNKVTFEPFSFNLSDLIHKNIQLNNEQARQKEIQIFAELPEYINVFGDLHMIDTVIRNILTNAIKFTYAGGEIKLSAVVYDNEVMVSIADSGIGLTQVQIDKLFDVESDSRKGTWGETGTGLGLVICHEFIKKNNGKIWATQNQPKGTIFHFTLPIKNK